MIEPKYQEPNGQYLQDIDRTDLPLGFLPVERSLVTIPPLQVGGNHIHSRAEGFIAIGSGLTIYWRDESGEIHSELMNPDDQLKLFVVKSLVPHAIKNEANEQAILLEYADQTQEESTYQPAHII